MTAHAELAAGWFSDEGIAVQTRASAADKPSTTVSSAINDTIPI